MLKMFLEEKIKCKILILFLFVLTGCSVDISESLFIASIGFEEIDGELNGYFYLPLSNDVGKSESEGKGTGEYVRVKGESVEKVFNNVKAVNSIDINLKHVSSVVLNVSLLKHEFLEEFVSYVKYSNLLDYNFYFLATKEKMEDIFSFQNPNQESVLNSLLVISGDNEGIRLVADPVHYLDFSKKYYDKRSILIPLLDIEELWNINGENVKNFYPQSAVYFYKGNVELVEKEKGSPYFRSNITFYDEIKNEPIYFNEYKMAHKKDVMEISLKYINFSDQDIPVESVKGLVYERIQEYLEKYKHCDPLDLYFWSEKFNINLNYKDLKIKINVIVN